MDLSRSQLPNQEKILVIHKRPLIAAIFKNFDKIEKEE
jgi:hypothetical protein